MAGADCRLTAAYDLTADEHCFSLTESLTASCDGEVIFARTTKADVPRDLA